MPSEPQLRSPNCFEGELAECASDWQTGHAWLWSYLVHLDGHSAASGDGALAGRWLRVGVAPDVIAGDAADGAVALGKTDASGTVNLVLAQLRDDRPRGSMSKGHLSYRLRRPKAAGR